MSTITFLRHIAPITHVPAALLNCSVVQVLPAQQQRQQQRCVCGPGCTHWSPTRSASRSWWKQLCSTPPLAVRPQLIAHYRSEQHCYWRPHWPESCGATFELLSRGIQCRPHHTTFATSCSCHWHAGRQEICHHSLPTCLPWVCRHRCRQPACTAGRAADCRPVQLCIAPSVRRPCNRSSCQRTGESSTHSRAVAGLPLHAAAPGMPVARVLQACQSTCLCPG